MDDEIRQTLLWLAERTDLSRDSAAVDAYERLVDRPVHRISPCATCGHDRSAHSIDGDADNPMPWPCEYPKHLGAPTWLCSCPDFMPMRAE